MDNQTENVGWSDASLPDLDSDQYSDFEVIESNLEVGDDMKTEEIPVPRDQSSHEDSDGGLEIPKILINSVELDDQQDGEEIAKSSTTNTAQLHQGQVYEGMYCSILTIFYWNLDLFNFFKGSKVPNENLNPEQKRKRAEKLGFLQELNQRLFPNQGGTSPGGNIPPGQGSPGMGPNGKNYFNGLRF